MVKTSCIIGDITHGHNEIARNMKLELDKSKREIHEIQDALINDNSTSEVSNSSISDNPSIRDR